MTPEAFAQHLAKEPDILRVLLFEPVQESAPYLCITVRRESPNTKHPMIFYFGPVEGRDWPINIGSVGPRAVVKVNGKRTITAAGQPWWAWTPVANWDVKA